MALLTPKQVAERLSVNRQKVWNMILDKQLKAINIARPGAKRPTYRIDEANLDLLFNENLAGNLVFEG